MLFPSYPMGTEEYYLFISAQDKGYVRGDFSYFNGKRIGVNKGSIQEKYLEEWAKEHGIQAELVELTSVE